jgi:hypothetical protein
LVAASFAALATAGGVQAATVHGSGRSDRLRGTNGADALYGGGGADLVLGLGGADLLVGGRGRDQLSGDAGEDRIAAALDRAADRVGCGAGRDIVTAELRDAVADDCEVVSRQLSRDPYRGLGAQHETEVEPDSFAEGRTIVTAFQIGRFGAEGGALSIGWATSGDGGRTWHSGRLPALSLFSRGFAERVSDPVVAYDRAHRTWLIAAVALKDNEPLLTVSRSRNGLRWSTPAIAAAAGGGDYDKEWLTCDNWRSSRFRGRCYLTYADFDSNAFVVRRSNDGGRTWSSGAVWPFLPQLGTTANGVQPIVRPNGTLVVAFAATDAEHDLSLDAIAVIRSGDGGVSFSRPVYVAGLHAYDILGLRSPPLPSAAQGADGTIWLAWSDCAPASDCATTAIWVSSSRDGISWRTPVAIPSAAPADNHFAPGLAVSGSGRSTRIAVAYYSSTRPFRCNYICFGWVDAWLSQSNDGARSWDRAQRLTAESMPWPWLADSNVGRMLGDYISTSFVRGKPIAVFSAATARYRDRYRQAIFATTRISPATARRRR